MGAITRREALLGALASLGGVGCSKASAAASCTDTAGLGADEAQARVAMEYVDRAASPTKACASCQQWLATGPAGAPAGCGGCRVLKGPIHPAGTCKLFALRT